MNENFVREAALQLTLKLFDKYDYREFAGPLPNDFKKITITQAAQAIGQAYKVIYQSIYETVSRKDPKQEK